MKNNSRSNLSAKDNKHVSAEDAKEAILRFCAHCLRPVIPEHVQRFAKSLGLTTKPTMKLLNELVAEGRLIGGDGSHREKYLLHYTDYPKYFTPKSKEEAQHFNNTIQYFNNYFYKSEELRLYFCQPESDQLCYFSFTSYGNDEHIKLVQAFMFTSEPWRKYLSLAGYDNAESLLYTLIHHLEQENDVYAFIPYLTELANCHDLPLHLSGIVKPFLHFYTKTLKGDLCSIENWEEEEDSAYFFYLKALHYHYQGKLVKAIAAYRKGIAEETEYRMYRWDYNQSKLIPESPFFALMYLIALRDDHRPASQKKLDEIYRDVSYSPDIHPLTVRIYLHHLYEKEHKLEKGINLNYLTDLEFVLSTLVLSHYQLVDLASWVKMTAAEFIMKNDWKLLQLESSHALEDFAPRQEALQLELGLNPILKPYVELKPWEEQLFNIHRLLKNRPKKNNASKGDLEQVEQGRIIYLISEDNNITPVLQKSKDGQKWTKGRNVALSSMAHGATEFMTETDKAIAVTIRHTDSWGRSFYHLNSPKSFAALLNHPHIYLASNRNISVQVVEEAPYLKITSTAKGFDVNCNVEIDSSEATIVKRESDILFKVININAMQRELIKLFQEQSHYPLEAKESLTSLCNQIRELITIHSDLLLDNKDMRQKEGSPRITAQILPITEGIKLELFSKPLENLPPYFKAGQDLEVCLSKDEEGQVLIKRDLKKESSNYRKTRKILREVAQDDSVEDTILFDEMYDCLELLDKLQEMPQVVRLEWPKGAELKIRGKVDFKQIHLSAFSRAQWLQVEGEVHVDEQLQISLAELLERSRNHQGRFVELEKGEYLALSKKLRKKLAEIDASLTPNKKGELQLSTFRSDLLSSMEEDGAKLKADKQYQALKKRIEAAYQLNIQVPEKLTAQLRDYQVEGYEWLCRLASWGAGACLADDMGLGKTIQSIAIMLERAQHGASLVVAPASVVTNWQREIARFAPSLKCHLLHDLADQRESIVNKAAAFDIVIATYGLMSRSNEAISKKAWNVILLDEAHNIKNRDTKCSKIAMALQGQFRLALTGTPIQNHLGEIWNLFQFTNPGLLGSFEQFKERYIIPIEKEKNRTRQQHLKRMIQPFLLRRTKSDVLDELPSKTEIIHHVELSAEERAVYENIRQHALTSLQDGKFNPIQTLAEITKLRQAACHPLLVNSELPIQNSAKLQRLSEIVEELIANKHSALIFSQFPSFLEKAKPLLDTMGLNYFYLDGQTPIKERERLVEDFQQGKAPIFLISLKAGGTGLNLTAADYVIHLDPWWNPAIEDQASDRSHRIGQTRPVTIYKLIAKQTIEERILEMHKNKKSLSDALLEGGNMSNKLTNKEILNLLQNNQA